MFERLQKKETADATATTTTFKANKLPDGDLLNKYKIISKESEQGMSLVYLLVMLIVISNLFYSNALDDKVSLPEDKRFSLGYGYLYGYKLNCTKYNPICPFLFLFRTAHKPNVTRNRETRNNILQSIM